MAVVGHDDGHDGHLRLDGKVEGALLEGQQHGLLGIAPCALGEHVHALLPVLHLVGGALHGVAGILGVLAVDEDGAAQRHEPAQERRLLQGGLGRHAAVLGEHAPQHEHVQLRLVVADEDGGADGLQGAVGVNDLEGDAGGGGHHVLEGAAGGPLRDAAVADDAQGDGGEGAIEGGGDEGDVGCQAAGDEAGLGGHGGEGIEEGRQGGIATQEIPQAGRDGHDRIGWEDGRGEASRKYREDRELICAAVEYATVSELDTLGIN